MQIGLYDVDGHNFPNLPLMKISAYHKQQGDSVDWANTFEYYDKVYMSKVFSDEYTPDFQYYFNAKEVIQGGTGYHIKVVDGVEVFDKENHKNLSNLRLYSIVDRGRKRLPSIRLNAR